MYQKCRLINHSIRQRVKKETAVGYMGGLLWLMMFRVRGYPGLEYLTYSDGNSVEVMT